MAISLSDVEKTDLKARVHAAACDGMAISIFALLWNMDKALIKEILDHVTEHDGQKTTPLVIAAMQGELKVVQVLLSNFDVDIEQRSTVRFDGYVIKEATALWCASGAGHLDIVKLLVKHGANINNSTATNSTPLRVACFDGSLEIVKYLLEEGADLNIPNIYNNTCLMISCYIGHKQVVRHLLEKGANPDFKAHCGSTSIHFAVERGHLEVIKELVHFGASMVKNDLGITPMLVAAECGKEEIVEYFLKLPECTRLERIEALELLGASFANDKETYSLEKTYKYLSLAMECRAVDTNPRNIWNSYDPIPKPQQEPIPAYDGHVECQNLQDLQAASWDRDAIHMEALTIRERILGRNNPEVPHPVTFRGAVFADSGQFDRCISLWMHAMVLRQTNNRSIAKDLLRFSQMFSQMVTIEAKLTYESVNAVLELGLKELQQHELQASQSNACDSNSRATQIELYQANILSMIYLIIIARRILTTEKETDTLHRIVYRFVKLKPCLKNGYSPLHIVLDTGICVDDFHVNSLVVFPDKELASMLITCGANVNAVDSCGNSPLHIIVNVKLPETKEGLRQSIIKKLLSKEAHIDIANAKRQTVFNIALGQTLVTLRSHSDLISLRCLAAQCIRRNNIPFKTCIPHCLESFVDMH